MALALGSFTGYTTYQSQAVARRSQPRDRLLREVFGMPDKYMREIEEILRNIERTEPRQDQGERIRPFARPSARRQSISLPHLEAPVTLILLGILLTLAGGSLAHYQMTPTLASGLIALAGFVLFVAGLALAWWARFRGVSSAPARSLRRPPPTDNVVRIRPARSNPFSRMLTNIRMRQMRRRYRNFSDH